MIPLGVLAQRQSVAAGSGVRSFIGSYPSDTDTTTYTFSVPVGAATSKTVIVAGTGRLNAAHALTGVTVGGSALTLDNTYYYANNGTGFIGHVTKATSGNEDIVVTFTAAMLRCGIGVWTVDGPISVVATTGVRTGTSGSYVFPLPAADHVIAYTTNVTNNPTAWANATERFDGPSGTADFWWHSGADGATANPTATATRSTATESIHVGASYNNA